MNPSSRPRIPTRPLAVGHLRAFEAVARMLNFSAAAQELALTQPAISRQIKSLEEELGLALFQRGTRRVELTHAGGQLLAVVAPQLVELDRRVRQLRADAGRQVINLTTFASFASLWLLPRLEPFQQAHPAVDIRISASDGVQDLDASGFDVALSYHLSPPPGEGVERLFGEVLAPVHSPARQARIDAGELPPLRQPADLAEHTLAEEDDNRPTSQLAQWRPWFEAQGLGDLQPRRWLLLNYTHQQVQATLAGNALTLARLPLVYEQLARGELIETFGPAQRHRTPSSYWMRLARSATQRPEVLQFCAWLREEAARTRAALRV